ncbi:DUF1566 domain-containing protein [Desulfobulbus rhabdoformis]|uniref:Lcl C-terminal domain-containing protein n=1 Tax=Desulfobulbus rhabdoformis TaxID=34032 RepID=UPI0019625F94|nr:DUF1566 domain-containing protein [Desulfobulbus rhabdoformis]MBM9613028.1 DUF1566 domain-containing protein [Desulfobulbus rhabdoformis]
MGLFNKLVISGIPAIDWDMTPDYTFGTFESWGGVERIRNNSERIYYFFIDAWDEEPKLCLMERGVKHAQVIAEILAPAEMVRACVQEQGKAALFERTFAINEELKQWLRDNVVNTDDDSKVVILEQREASGPVETGLPKRSSLAPLQARITLPDQAEELSEEDVVQLVQSFNFCDQERNPEGSFVSELVDNEDGLTVSDQVTGLMWQREGLDIMSHRSMRREVARVNDEQFAGYSDWRLPTMAEALSLLEQEKLAHDQYLPRCFSGEQPFVFVDAVRKPGGQWFVDFKQGRAFWSSGTIPGGFGRLCRREK